MLNVVLVPGILGFDRIGPFSYFNGVEAHLKKHIPQAHVLAADTHPIGSIELRASKLEQQLTQALHNGVLRTDWPVHIIAHSMGGLDVRRLVAQGGAVALKVKTLACLATPHLGTALADLIVGAAPASALATLIVNSSQILHQLRQHTMAIQELTPDALANFNTAYPASTRVRYIHVVGGGRASLRKTSWLFAPTHVLLENLEGANDGIVSAASASAPAGEKLLWSGDHADLIGHNLDDPVGVNRPAFDHLNAYLELVRSF